jgi:hypothetical protein
VGVKSTLGLRAPLPCVVSLLRLSTYRRYGAGRPVVPARTWSDQAAVATAKPYYRNSCSTGASREMLNCSQRCVSAHRMPSFNRHDCLQSAYVIVRKVPVAGSRHDQFLVFSVRTWWFQLRITKVREHPLWSVLVPLQQYKAFAAPVRIPFSTGPIALRSVKTFHVEIAYFVYDPPSVLPGAGTTSATPQPRLIDSRVKASL